MVVAGGAGGSGLIVANYGGGSGVVILTFPISYAAAASTTGTPTISANATTRYYIFKNTGSITF